MENGKAAEGQVPGPTPEQTRQMAQERAIKMITGYCDSIVGCMFNGIINSGQQPGIPPELLVMAMCESLARTICNAYVADNEINVRKFRKDCQRAFETILKEFPVRTTPPAMPQTADAASISLPEVKF